jgi:hypothetical protein
LFDARQFINRGMINRTDRRTIVKVSGRFLQRQFAGFAHGQFCESWKG